MQFGHVFSGDTNICLRLFAEGDYMLCRTHQVSPTKLDKSPNGDAAFPDECSLFRRRAVSPYPHLTPVLQWTPIYVYRRMLYTYINYILCVIFDQELRYTMGSVGFPKGFLTRSTVWYQIF